jgi:Ca2+:H+ antiporter
MGSASRVVWQAGAVSRLVSVLRFWPIAFPVAALIALGLTWGRDLSSVAVIIVAGLLAAAVLAAVHHAEVVAHRVGEPFGSLILAVAVTVIEVALIVTIMLSAADESSSLARDTVFAAVMVTLNGIVGICLLVVTLRGQVATFNAEGTGGALATVAAVATMTLVLPAFTTSSPGPTFSPGQLAFAAVASLALYGLFVFVQTVRHRDYFLPVSADGRPLTEDEHMTPPSTAVALASLGVLLVALVGVVGLAKAVSPTVEGAIRSAGLPLTLVGVVIALLILLPETLAAIRAAHRGRVQTSLNLAFGSAMASIGLTIPTIAVASIWIDSRLLLGLGGPQIVLLALTVVVGVLTVTPGRATLLEAGVHLTLFAAFLVLAASP